MSPITSREIFNVIEKEGKLIVVMDVIREWHLDCEHGQNGECEIYDALRSDKTDKEIVETAYDVDADLFDQFNLGKITIRRWEFVPVMYEYTVEALSLNEAIKKLQDGDESTYNTRTCISKYSEIANESTDDEDDVDFWRVVGYDGEETFIEDLLEDVAVQFPYKYKGQLLSLSDLQAILIAEGYPFAEELDETCFAEYIYNRQNQIVDYFDDPLPMPAIIENLFILNKTLS